MIVNVLGALTVGLCAWLLCRAFIKTGKRLLLWSSLCFAGLAIANVVLIIDLTMIPQVDLYRLRLSIAAVSMLLLLYGLIFESD
ncbi:MAG: DUF5985 family protein [Pseudomonadota bacterium]